MTTKKVLLVDDNAFAEQAMSALEAAGYPTRVATSCESAQTALASMETDFVVLHKVLQGVSVENGILERLVEAAGDGLVVVYTTRADLAPDVEYRLLDQGAVRVIDRLVAADFAASVAKLTEEFSDLVDISEQLALLLAERERLACTLLGTKSTLTVVDRSSICWFTSRDRGGVGGGIQTRRGPCWAFCHGFPAEAGPCWGCGARRIADDSRAPVETLVLTRVGSADKLVWESVRSSPICNDEGRVVAVADNVIEASPERIEALPTETRLDLIAQGVLRSGFGRIRIYRTRLGGGGAALEAARARTDDPTSAHGEHFRQLRSFWFDYENEPYALSAIKRRGQFFPAWDTEMGHSRLEQVDGLKLTPPFFILPIFTVAGSLIGIAGIDFTGVDDLLPEKPSVMKRKLANEATLEWIQRELVPQIRAAMTSSVSGGPAAESLWRTIGQAELGVGAARSLDEALKAFREAIAGVAKATAATATVRIQPLGSHSLVLLPELSFGPSPSLQEDIPLSDSTSIAATCFRSWARCLIEDFPRYARDRTAQGLGALRDVSKKAKSLAVIPLRFEVPNGVLTLEATHRINWETTGYVEPLCHLAALAALLVRDLQIARQHEAEVADRTAIIAFASSTSADSVWKHWATQRIQDASQALETLGSYVLPSASDSARARAAIEDAKRAIDAIVAEAPGHSQMPTCDLGDSLNHLRRRYRATAGLTIDIPAYTPGEVTVAMSRFYVVHILGIMVDNSIRAIQQERKSGRIWLAVNQGADSVEIEVGDDGPGIEEQVANDLFRTRIESAGGGRGVGLLYARGAALQWKGNLRLIRRSSPTLFVLTAPRAPDKDGHRGK